MWLLSVPKLNNEKTGLPVVGCWGLDILLILLFKGNPSLKYKLRFSQKLLLVDVLCSVAILCSDTVNMSGYLQWVELVHQDTQGNRSKQWGMWCSVMVFNFIYLVAASLFTAQSQDSVSGPLLQIDKLSTRNIEMKEQQGWLQLHHLVDYAICP